MKDKTKIVNAIEELIEAKIKVSLSRGRGNYLNTHHTTIGKKLIFDDDIYVEKFKKKLRDLL